MKQLIRKLAQSCGYEIRRQTPDLMGVCPFRDIERLVPEKQTPLMIDIGANEGQTATRMLNLFPKANIHCFEPGTAAFATLQTKYVQDSQVTLNQMAVSDTSGELSFFESRHSDLSSLLPMTDKHQGLASQQTTVKSTTLDQYASDQQLSQISVLKSDTQGADLSVLQGAQNLLQNQTIDLVLTEILFHSIYKGRAELDEIYRYMREQNYRLVSFYSPHFRGNCVGCLDALFIREQLVNDTRK